MLILKEEMMPLDEVNALEHYADNIHPNWPGLVRASQIDAPIAERPCQNCGSTRQYRQIINSGSHRAFAVCLVCEDAVEF